MRRSDAWHLAAAGVFDVIDVDDERASSTHAIVLRDSDAPTPRSSAHVRSRASSKVRQCRITCAAVSGAAPHGHSVVAVDRCRVTICSAMRVWQRRKRARSGATRGGSSNKYGAGDAAMGHIRARVISVVARRTPRLPAPNTEPTAATHGPAFEDTEAGHVETVLEGLGAHVPRASVVAIRLLARRRRSRLVGGRLAARMAFLRSRSASRSAARSSLFSAAYARTADDGGAR